ncbi:hypothetical protein BH23GEM7_BH23GEM7_16770 [soil metagenome]
MRAFLLLIILLLAATGCQDGTTAPPVAADQDLPADQIAYGVQHIMTTQGVRKAVLDGDTAYLYQSGRTMDIVGVELSFYNEAGSQTGHLTAETGNYDSASGQMVARGNVVLTTLDTDAQRRLETEELHYDLNGDRMWSDVAVVLHDGPTTVYGTSFRADARFQNRVIEGARTTGGVRPESRGISF